MKIKILPKKILENIQSEEDLSDQSIMECLYAIRALKVAVYYGDETVVEVGEMNTAQQVYIDQFSIWMTAEEYVVVEK
jgi:hypothetical protein